MSTPFIGQLKLVGFNFAPQGWAFCNGQLLPINQNPALFSILGTTYGGDGVQTFALPNLQSRVPIHFGQGPGLSPYNLGQTGGAEAVTLSTAQMPPHTHPLGAVPVAATTDVPTGNVLAQAPVGMGNVYDPGPANVTMASNAIASLTGGQGHENRQPVLAINYIIALVGVFPSRS